MGKWTKTAKALPKRADTADGPFRERVNELKDDYRKATEQSGIAGLAALYRAARDEKEAKEAILSGVNAQVMALEELLMAARETEAWREVCGVSKDGELRPFSFADGSRVELSDQLSVRVEDADALAGWVRENQLERLLSLHAKRVESLTKQLIEDGNPPPAGVAIEGYVQVKLVRKK